MAISPGINNESQEQLQESPNTEAQANTAATLLKAAPDGKGSESADPNLTTGPAEAEQQPATTPLTNESTQETRAPIPPATQAIPPAQAPADMTQLMTAMISYIQKAEERAEQAMQLQKQQAEESNKMMLDMFNQLMTQNKQTPTPSQANPNPGQPSDEEGSDNETEPSTTNHLPQASYHPNITRRGQDRAPSDSSPMLMENHTSSTDAFKDLSSVTKTTACTYYQQKHEELPESCDGGTFIRWMQSYNQYQKNCKAMGKPALPPQCAMGHKGRTALQALLSIYAPVMQRPDWAYQAADITDEQCYAFLDFWKQHAFQNAWCEINNKIIQIFSLHLGTIPKDLTLTLVRMERDLTRLANTYDCSRHTEFTTLQTIPEAHRVLTHACLDAMHPIIRARVTSHLWNSTGTWRQFRLPTATPMPSFHDLLIILRSFYDATNRQPFADPAKTRHSPSKPAPFSSKPPKKSPTFTGSQSGNTCPACHDNHDFLTWNSRTKRLNRNCSQKLSDTDFQTYKQAFLAANPGTAKLHKAAVEQHKNRLAKAKATSAKPSSSDRRHIATSARSPKILTQPKDLEQLLKTPPARVYSNAQPTVPLFQKKSCIIDT